MVALACVVVAGASQMRGTGRFVWARSNNTSAGLSIHQRSLENIGPVSSFDFSAVPVSPDEAMANIAENISALLATVQ